MVWTNRRARKWFGLVAVFGVLTAVVAIGMSQTLADWWSGSKSGIALLDGPIGGVRAIRSVLEFGWLGDGLGVHIVMWCAVVIVMLEASPRAVAMPRLPMLVGLLAAFGIALELMQGAWTLRNPSVGDIVGNLTGMGLGVLWATRRVWSRSSAIGGVR